MRGTKALLGVLVGSAMAVPILAAVGVTAAGADPASGVGPNNGAIKICKTFVNATPALAIPTIPNATFTITGGGDNTGQAAFSIPVSVPAIVGTTQCGVVSGLPNNTASVVVTETNGNTTAAGTSSSFIMAIAQTEPVGTSLTASSLTGGTATIATANGVIDVVNFTNTLSPGWVEVCKSTPASSGLTGPFTFTLTGNDGFTTTATATLGAGVTNACSSPIEVPAGPVKAQENGANLNVIAISATINGAPTSALNGPNLVQANATYNVLSSDIVTKGVAISFNPQTDITFTDNVVGLEVCKSFSTVNGSGGSLATASFPFTVTPAAGSVAGPAAGFTVSLKPGTCSNPVNFRAGTQVTITEGPVAGTKVQSITTDGLGESTVSGSPSALNATTTIIIGTPVNSATALVPADEAIVTFSNQVADSGQLKICKLAGTVPGAPIGTVFSFTVSGAPGVTTLVNLGQCAIVGGSTTPTLFPFNSVQTITELGSAGNNASAVSVVPTFVNENVAGVATPTTEAVLGTVTGLLSQGAALGANATAQVIISEGSGGTAGQNVSGSTTTEVAFTNVDPPAPGTPIVTVNNPGFNAGTTTGPVGSVSTIASSIGSVLISTPTFSTSSSSAVQAIAPTTVAPQVLTAAQKKALLKSENKKLANVKAAITHENLLIKTATGKALKADHKRLTQLKNQLKLINTEIKLIK